MRRFLFGTVAVILFACSPLPRFSSEDIRAVVSADDTNGVAEIIKERGINGYINLPFSSFTIPIIVLAAENRATNTLRLLLEQGANPNATNYKGQTALIQLCAYGNSSESNMAAVLIQHGAKVSHKEAYGWEAIHYAVFKNKPEFVALLLKHGADPTTKDREGRTLRDWPGLTNRLIIKMLEKLRGVASKLSTMERKLD